ncbi:MAG TPA: hypothetical protein VGL35_01965 [Rhizomicrobium sp.]|jgi:hypothetical protein
MSMLRLPGRTPIANVIRPGVWQRRAHHSRRFAESANANSPCPAPADFPHRVRLCGKPYIDSKYCGYRMTPLYDIVSAQPSVDARQIRRNQMKLAMPHW